MSTSLSIKYQNSKKKKKTKYGTSSSDSVVIVYTKKAWSSHEKKARCLHVINFSKKKKRSELFSSKKKKIKKKKVPSPRTFELRVGDVRGKKKRRFFKSIHSIASNLKKSFLLVIFFYAENQVPASVDARGVCTFNFSLLWFASGVIYQNRSYQKIFFFFGKRKIKHVLSVFVN